MLQGKEDWGPGPWQSEPDHEEFSILGFDCVIHRNQFGVLCGYLAIPKGHPWHGLHTEDLDVEVHGGLNYSADRAPGREPKPGEWWIGFDCGHAWDVVPGFSELHRVLDLKIPGRSYKGVAYVIGELGSLVQQLVAAAVRATKSTPLDNE